MNKTSSVYQIFASDKVNQKIRKRKTRNKKITKQIYYQLTFFLIFNLANSRFEFQNLNQILTIKMINY